MSSTPNMKPESKALVWIGWIVSVLPALFLLLDGAMKLVKPEPVLKATMHLGYHESVLTGMAIVLIVSTILYLIPLTAAVGAILLTGYLGGAVASHVRVGDPNFDTCFPIIFGVLLWTGLVLRDRRLRIVLPF